MKGNTVAGPSAKDMKKWQAEDDLRTLINAEKIKKDKPRLAAAMKYRDEQLASLTKIDED